MFNLLKLDYFCCNSWTFKQVVSQMNKHELITINAMAREDFLNLEFFLNKYYQSLEFSKPDKSHILTIYSNIYGKEPTILYKQDDIFLLKP